MQIVIKIPESIIEHLKDGSFGARKEDRATLVDEVMNGTPLPKGHGRLIDADKLNIYDVSPADGFVVMGVTEEDIDLAPTIIDADKGVNIDE